MNRKICRSLALIAGLKAKMTEKSDTQHLLQNADQLFDQHQYEDAINLLKKYPVEFAF